MASTSGWSWRSLLTPGALGSSSDKNAGNQGNEHDEVPPWAEPPPHPLDLPNVLGIENYGNTCYVNSIMQALWLCDPFREAILAYFEQVSRLRGGSANQVASTSKEPMKGANEVQQQEIITLFSAVQTLFQQMAKAQSTKAEQGDTVKAESSGKSQPNPSSLSRKTSTKPTTSGRGGAGNVVPGTVSNATWPSAKAAANAAQLSTCGSIVIGESAVKAFLLAIRKSNKHFDSQAHQDAHEFLNHILNAVADEVVREANRRVKDVNEEAALNPILDTSHDGKTFVHRIFEGVLTNETRCMTCESVTSRDECFLDLSLDIERNLSISGCLQQFSASEMLCSRNKFYCDTCCALQEAEKRMKIKKQPVVLALHLKRFKYEESMDRFVKLTHRVVFPMQLRLSNLSDEADEPDKLYNLQSIIVHIGQGPHHGHYIAIIRIATRWFLFDDETIRIIDEEDIQRYYGDASAPGSAYVLFYQAADIDYPALGIPDVPKIRAERARRRKLEAAAKRRAAKQEADRAAVAIGVVNGAHGAATPLRTGTPAEGKSLFGRRPLSLSTSASTNVAAGSAGDGPTSPTDSSKTSWLSSLKPRKPSLSVAQPIATKQGGGDGAASRASPPKDSRGSPTQPVSRQRSPSRSIQSEGSQATSVSPVASTAAPAVSAETGEAAPAVQHTTTSTSQRVLSGLGFGSPPTRVTTFPSMAEETPSLGSTGKKLVGMDGQPQTGFMGGRRASAGLRPATGNASDGVMPTPSESSKGRFGSAFSSRLRSTSVSVDLRGKPSGPSTATNSASATAPTSGAATPASASSHAASQGANANGSSLGRRRTTLSRAMGMIRPGKDKDK